MIPSPQPSPCRTGRGRRQRRIRLSNGIGEQGKVFVAFGENWIGQRPLDCDCWIIPTHTSGEVGKKELGHLVKNFRIVRETLEAMGKSARNIKHPAILCCQLEAFPFAEGWRVRSNIHSDVE